MIKLGLLLISVFAISLAYDCAPHLTDYNWPDSTNCRYYYHCQNGKSTSEACFILFRKFNPETLHCDWAWKVNCSAVSHLPIPETHHWWNKSK
uniref:Putative secreted protein with chitin-binding domain type 2 n=1 Tax=Panstrongylus lignarius TaxID=156445 RepID=A0A224Y219_9HEMI